MGGSLGRPFEPAIKGDKTNPQEGTKQSDALVANEVTAVIGFCNTGVAVKLSELFRKAQRPLISPFATGTPLTSDYPAPDSCILQCCPRCHFAISKGYGAPNMRSLAIPSPGKMKPHNSGFLGKNLLDQGMAMSIFAGVRLITRAKTFKNGVSGAAFKYVVPIARYGAVSHNA